MASNSNDFHEGEDFTNGMSGRASIWRCPHRPATATGTAAYDALEHVLRRRALKRDGRAVVSHAVPSAVEDAACRVVSAIDDLRARAEVPRWLLGIAIAGFLVAVAWMSLGPWLFQSGPPCPVHPVVGRVAMGKVVPAGAQLVFHPVAGELPDQAVPRATVRDDGSFAVSTFRQDDGAPEGEYVVTAQWFRVTKDGAPGRNVFPHKYATPGSSPLRVAISPGANQLSPLAICR